MTSTKEYRELVEFLTHKNKSVSGQALDILCQYSGDPEPEFIAFVKSGPEFLVRPLLRLIESDDKESVESSLTALINLAVIDCVAESAIKLSAVRRVCDLLNQKQDFVDLYCMLLSNLTRLPAGIESLLTIGTLFKSVVLKYAAVDSEEVDHLGSVVINGTSVEKGRRILCDLQTDSQGYTHCLLLQCLARCLSIRRRRMAVLQMIRNLALDTECHDAISASGILINICYFLYPESDARREDDVHKNITEHGIGLATDIETRSISAEIFVCVLRSEVGRDVMRAIGVYEVVRVWDLCESEQSIKDMIYDVAMATHLNEDELKSGELQEEPNRVVDVSHIA